MAKKKSPDIFDEEYVPYHKELFSKVITSEIGKYYYSKIIGEKLDIEDLIIEEKGRWYWKGHLHQIDFLIQLFEKCHGNNSKSQTANLIRRLKKVDEQRNEDVGQMILEILADIAMTLPISEQNKKVYQQRVKEARAKLKKLRNAKNSFLKKLADSEEVSQEEIEELDKKIEAVLRKSKSEAMITTTFVYYSGGFLPALGQPIKGKQGRVPRTFGKEKPLLEEGIIKLYKLLDPQEKDKGHYRTAKDIEYFLIKIGIKNKSADNIRKTIQKRLSI